MVIKINRYPDLCPGGPWLAPQDLGDSPREARPWAILNSQRSGGTPPIWSDPGYPFSPCNEYNDGLHGTGEAIDRGYKKVMRELLQNSTIVFSKESDHITVTTRESKKKFRINDKLFKNSSTYVNTIFKSLDIVKFEGRYWIEFPGNLLPALGRIRHYSGDGEAVVAGKNYRTGELIVWIGNSLMSLAGEFAHEWDYVDEMWQDKP